jgi:SAM-dependent methyltransferase
VDLIQVTGGFFWELINNKKVHLVGVDYNIAFCPTVVTDLKCSIPFKNAVADSVIVSSFLYIGPDPEGLLEEVYRVLKSGGWILLTAPLVFPHNPEPTDYWRFTDEAPRLLLHRSGFAEVDITPIGERFSAVAYLLSPFLRPRWLVAPFVYWLCLKLDAWTKGLGLQECHIGYVAKARKP